MAAMDWGRPSCGNNSNGDNRNDSGGDDDEVAAGGGDGITAAGEVLGGERMGFVQVMTDEQMEVLRRQIAAYAAICEQLVEMHKAVTAQQDTIAGMRLGGLYSDSMMTPSGHKITGRQRWTPTSMQLQILENMFDQGIGTPSKQRIKEITLELSHHGQISEANVYNWFQNRRARSKRKQTPAQTSLSEPEADADDESSTEKKLRAELHPNENQHVRTDHNHQLHNVQGNHDLHYLNSELLQAQGMYPSNESSKSSGSSGQMSFNEHVLSNLRTDNFTGKMDIQGSYMAYRSGESYNMMH